MPVVVLHTKGRRSGQRRINALAYFKDNGNFLVVASNTGEPRQPAWWLNLRQMTETEIELRGRLRPVHPREAGGDERERLWSRLVAINRDYDVYQRRTNRQIPVVVLEPLSQRR
jgi:deazaflavin-dependent oxidoreductase (nitroreductase family)